MSTRLQVIVPDALDRRIRRSAHRRRLTSSAFVREAIERALAEEEAAGDPLEQLASLETPTSDLERMLGDIERGRRG
jgi:hypothetical protein